MELLLRAGSQIDAPSPCHADSALAIVSSNGHAGCLRVLLKHHVRLDGKTADGLGALELAIKHSHPQCVQLLEEEQAGLSCK